MLKRLPKLYAALGVLLLNTLLIFVCINVALLGYPAALAPPTPTIASGAPLQVYHLGPLRLDFDLARQAYPGRSDGAIIWLLLETHNLARVCDPVTKFREVPYLGENIHIDVAGYRWNAPHAAPFPPPTDAYTVFLFGGSTAFGFGESDANTIAAFLEKHLRQHFGSTAVYVYNFGRIFYYSDQERALFQALLANGAVPDVAIFLDGLNDFVIYSGTHPPDFESCVTNPTQRLRLNNTLQCRSDELCLPLQALVSNRRQVTPIPTPYRDFSQDKPAAAPTDAVYDPPLDDPATNRAVIARWLANKSAIEQSAAEHGVQTLFVMQPVPLYGYDLAYHLYYDEVADFGGNARVHYGYVLWDALYQEGALGARVLNLAHLGADAAENVYVDVFHYNAIFMDEIARALVEALVN